MSKWRQWLLALGFGLSLAIVVLFALRSIHYVQHLREQEAIQPWMSVPYIARTRHVPASVLYQALGLPVPPGRDRRPLLVIAREQGRPVENVIAVLQEAINQYRLSQGTPSPVPPVSTPGNSSGSAP
ncbi:MAG: hypothetical protein M1281_16335 [Chloroflexi bacterium]|nr:hypothetical protein [Chloroflexota bacterium]